MADELPGWTLSKELGSGHFAKVKLGTRKSDGLQVAVKIIKKPKGSKIKLVQAEVDILKKIDHPYIVKCFDHYDTGEKMYLMMELMDGGELFDRIVDKGHYTEDDCKVTTAKLLDAIRYLHEAGIAHRDLKPENMLMTDTTENAEVKITDFGLGKVFDAHSEVMQTPCGTPGYIAPEVLMMKGYNKACDIWSLGVIIYILLCGFPPFYADNDALLFEKIKKGEFQFLRPYWDPISDVAKDLIRKMLTVDWKQRVTAQECLQHPFVKAQAQELNKQQESEQMRKQSLENFQKLKDFNAHRKLKGVFQMAIAVERMKTEEDMSKDVPEQKS